MSITITGTDVVAKALREAAGKLSDREMELCLVAGGLVLSGAAKRNAPFISGTLRRSIHVGGHAGASDAQFDGGSSDIGGNEPLSIRIGTNLPYARRIEDGFTGTDSLGRQYDQPAQPYLRPAADEAGPAAVQEVADAVAALLGTR